MSTFTGDSRLGTELMYPNRKPVIPIKVDWGNFLTRDLLICPLATVTGIKDLTDIKNTTSIHSGATYGGVLFDGVDDALIYSLGTNLANEPMSVTAVFKPFTDSGTAANQQIISCGNFNYALTHTNSAFQNALSVYDGSWVAIQAGEVVKKDVVHIITITIGAAGAFLYIDGKEVAKDIIETAFVAGSVFSFMSSGAISNAYGVFYMGAIHARQLPKSEVIPFHRNPYQFLLPDIGT